MGHDLKEWCETLDRAFSGGIRHQHSNISSSVGQEETEGRSDQSPNHSASEPLAGQGRQEQAEREPATEGETFQGDPVANAAAEASAVVHAAKVKHNCRADFDFLFMYPHVMGATVEEQIQRIERVRDKAISDIESGKCII